MNQEKTSLAPGENFPGPALGGWYTYVSLAIAGVILVGFAALLDPKEIWREVIAANKNLLLLGALAHYATYPVRGLRWRRSLIHFPVQGGPGKFGLIVFFYTFVDNLVPAKLADLYGAHLARINCGVRRSAALGSIVFLRTADAWTILLLAFGVSWVLFSATMAASVVWTLVVGGIIAVATTSVMLVFIFLKKSSLTWLPAKAREMVHAFHTGMWPNTSEIAPIAMLTLLVWALETLWIFLLVLAFGVILGIAAGAALIEFIRARRPARGVRVIVAPDAVPRRRAATLANDAFTDSPVAVDAAQGACCRTTARPSRHLEHLFSAQRPGLWPSRPSG